MNEINIFLNYFQAGDLWSIEHQFKPEYLEKEMGNLIKVIQESIRVGKIEIVEFLISKGCNYDISDEEGMNSIHHACIHGRINILHLFRGMNLDFKHTDKQNMQPIHHACVHGRLNIVQYFQENNFDLEQPDIYGLRPIHHACIHGRIDIVKFFHENGFNMEYLDKEEMRPIHHACVHNRLHIVQFLSQMCDMKAKDIRGWTPLDHANHHARSEIVQFLIAHQPNLEASFSNPCEDNTLHLKIKEKIQNIINNPCFESCNHLFCYNTIFSKKSKYKHFIGGGGFGRVYKIQDPEMKFNFAVKTLKAHSPDEKKEVNNLELEINHYRERLNHPRIIRFYASSIQNSKIFIFMEYAEKGSLHNVIQKNGPLEHSKIIRYSQQILEGLKFLHENHYFHRDVKPKNILMFSNDCIKLCDFGLSRAIETISKGRGHGGADSAVGTANYMAPELIECARYGGRYDYSVDIWSLGASIVEMLTGEAPYSDLLSPQAIMFKIGIEKSIKFHPSKPMSAEFTKLLSSMLESNPVKRPTASKLLIEIQYLL